MTTLTLEQTREMATPKTTWELASWGIYSEWDRDAKTLPKIRKFGHTVPALLGIEFGYVLKVKKGKGKKLTFCIEHPPFLDTDGEVTPPFTGEVYVRTNDWDFFLGDTVWEPVSDKVGPWRLTIRMEGEVIADETFVLVEEGDARLT